MSSDRWGIHAASWWNQRGGMNTPSPARPTSVSPATTTSALGMDTNKLARPSWPRGCLMKLVINGWSRWRIIRQKSSRKPGPKKGSPRDRFVEDSPMNQRYSCRSNARHGEQCQQLGVWLPPASSMNRFVVVMVVSFTPKLRPAIVGDPETWGSPVPRGAK